MVLKLKIALVFKIELFFRNVIKFNSAIYSSLSVFSVINIGFYSVILFVHLYTQSSVLRATGEKCTLDSGT